MARWYRVSGLLLTKKIKRKKKEEKKEKGGARIQDLYSTIISTSFVVVFLAFSTLVFYSTTLYNLTNSEFGYNLVFGVFIILINIWKFFFKIKVSLFFYLLYI